tara:strand:- start:1111 stop:1905 length:795 start_codon:yes stop_codon:yes gene_type:complete
MESTYIIETQEPKHITNAKEYLNKAEETNCLGVELSKYRKALNTLLTENKRLEQNERLISDEMEQIEYIIDSLYPPKPLWIEGYEINNTNTNKNKWCDNLDNDPQFLELYEFDNDINYFHTNELIHQLLKKPHEYRDKFDNSTEYLNQYDQMLLNNIQITTIGENYCTGDHEIWGKIYIPKEVATKLGIYEGNTDNFSSIVKYTNNNIPWRIPDSKEVNIVFAGNYMDKVNNKKIVNHEDLEDLIMKSNQLYCNTNKFCTFSNK